MKLLGINIDTYRAPDGVTLVATTDRGSVVGVVTRWQAFAMAVRIVRACFR